MTEVKTGTAYYQLGNCLRGYFYGDFASDQDAWEKLGDAFNRAWPSRSGRSVEMWKIVREGTTKGGNETERDKALREKLDAYIAREKANADAP
jgi:hypothetical protein